MKILNSIFVTILCIFLFSGCQNSEVPIEKEEVDNKKLEIKDTYIFSFSYSVGYHINASYDYEIRLNENGSYEAFYKADGVAPEDRLSKIIDKEIVSEFENILTKYKIYKWNGFHESDLDVLDGDSFYLHYMRKDKESISASGYMKYPKGYRDFRSEIHNFFTDLFKEEVEK